MPGPGIRRATVGLYAGVFLLLSVAGTATSGSTTAHAKTKWRATVAKLPANAATGGNRDASIGSISCPSPGNCSAVGSYTDDAGVQEGLLLTERAGHWGRGVEAVLPANADSNPDVSVTSVSCASAGNCTAVGTYTDNGLDQSGLLLTEKAGQWAVGVEAPVSANVVLLTSVSCASAGNCTAVGNYGFFHGLLLTEKAGHWAAGVTAPLPSDADRRQEALLYSVSCTPNGSCSAVGYYNFGTGRVEGAGQGLLLTKRRGTWRSVDAVMPPDGPGEGVALTSVSCASGGNCGAIGLYNISIDGGSGPEIVLLNETAGKWRPGVAAKPPKPRFRFLRTLVDPTDISCPVPGECVAVDTYSYTRGDRVLSTLLTEHAGKWGRGVLPLLPRDAKVRRGAGLAAVSCASAGNCTVVGGYSSGGLLLSEIAGHWERGVRAPLRATAYVSSVSCASPGNCGAAGWSRHGRVILLDSVTKH